MWLIVGGDPQIGAATCDHLRAKGQAIARRPECVTADRPLLDLSNTRDDREPPTGARGRAGTNTHRDRRRSHLQLNERKRPRYFSVERSRACMLAVAFYLAQRIGANRSLVQPVSLEHLACLWDRYRDIRRSVPSPCAATASPRLTLGL
jgi:hypothetical protein